MKLPSLNLSGCFKGASKPFDELKLTDTQVAEKVAKLKIKGYFTVKFSQKTKSYLDKQIADPNNVMWHQTIVQNSLPLPENFEQVATEMACAVVSTITQQKANLVTQEFEIRQPGPYSAAQWHQDKAPKLLACVATIKGHGTEFVKPVTANARFRHVEEKTLPIELREEHGLADEKIHTAKKDRFYFFAARGVASDAVPKLVHRAPPNDPEAQEKRSIFLARWKADRSSEQ